MRAHLHLLSILQLVWGAIALLLGLSMLLLALGAVAIGVAGSGDQVAAAVTAVAFGVFAAALIVGGVVNGWCGTALRRMQASGRMTMLVVSVLNLFVLPFGTALAIYAYWVLLHNDTRAMFESSGRAVTPAG